MGPRSHAAILGLSLSLSLSLSLGLGCRTPAPAPKTPSPWPGGERSAWIEVITTGGSGTRVFDPEGMRSLPAKALPSLFFGDQDQCLFAFGLREELARTGAFSRVALFQPRGAEEMQIRITFTHSFHEDDHSYTLDARLDAEGKSAPLRRSYCVRSSEGSSWWGRMTTSAWQGKQRAHRRLMDLMLADLRSWMASP